MNFTDTRNIVFEILIIFILSIAIGIIFNAFSPNGISLLYKTTDISDQDNISVILAHQLYLEGRTLFVDARYPDEYAKSYIRNSLNLPASWPIDKIDTTIHSLDRDKLIVVYCSDSDCTYSVRVAGILRYLKFTNVLIFRGGIDEWKFNKFPLIETK